MRKILLILIASTTIAYAADVPKEPAKPTCGKTIEECQKIIDAQAKQIKTLGLQFQTAVQQRDSLAKNLNDNSLANFVQQNDH